MMMVIIKSLLSLEFWSHDGSFMAWTLLCFLILVALFLWWIRPKSIDPSIPGPTKRHAVFGIQTLSDVSHLTGGIAFDWAHWPTFSLKLSQHYKFQTWGAPTPNIGFGGAFFNIVAPRCLEYILRDNFSNYEKGKLSRSFKELMGESAFNTDAAKWKFHRKISVGLLNRETVEHGVLVMNEKLSRLEEIIREKYCKEGQTFDFQQIAYSLIMDVFVKVGFGIDLNELGSDKYAPFVEALDELNYHIHTRFLDLFWEIKQRFTIGKREKRVKELTEMIDNFADVIIQAVKSEAHQEGNHINGKENSNHSEDTRRNSNIVSRYIASCKQRNLPTPTNRELRDIVIGFVFAGRDTTAVGLTWTLFELTKHPEAAARIRKEVHEVTNGGKIRFTYEMVHNRMPFLHAAVLESLRLHPPVPESFRFAIHSDVLPDGTKIPAGSLIMFSNYTINHSDQVWDDPGAFYPERFYGKKEPSPFAFASFIGGPRTCSGAILALVEIKMCVAFLLARFSFENAKDHDGSYHWTTVMSMKDGFHVQVATL